MATYAIIGGPETDHEVGIDYNPQNNRATGVYGINRNTTRSFIAGCTLDDGREFAQTYLPNTAPPTQQFPANLITFRIAPDGDGYIMTGVRGTWFGWNE